MTAPAPLFRFTPARADDVSAPFALPGGLLVLDAAFTANGPAPRLAVRLRNVDGSSDGDAAESAVRRAEPGMPLAARHALSVLGGTYVLAVTAADCTALTLTLSGP